MSKTFVLGDVHGANIALEQVLERSGFNKEEDILITLGDICDGWPYVYECVEILLGIKNRIDIIGNHDKWFHTFLTSGNHPQHWLQGGVGTAKSYLRHIDKEDMILRGYEHSGYISSLNSGDIPVDHWKFFMYQHLYYIDDKNRMFVHGGFWRDNDVAETKRNYPSQFYWDRELWNEALSCKKEQKLKTANNFSKIFIGHTTTVNWKTKEEITQGGIIIPKGAPMTLPMHSGGVWNIDTGAGWGGVLTIMDVDTEEYWQSDNVEKLFPDDAARRN